MVENRKAKGVKNIQDRKEAKKNYKEIWVAGI